MSSQKDSIDLNWFTAALIATTAPIIALLAHQGAVRRTMLLAALKPTSTFAGFLRGTYLRTFLSAVVALIISGVLVLQMLLPATREWLFLILVGQALFVVVALRFAQSWLRRHFQPWSQVHVVQQLVVLAAAGAAALAAVQLLPLQDGVTLEQALETTPFPNAPLVDVLAISQSVVDGLQRMALGETAAMDLRLQFAAYCIYFVLWLPPFLASAAVFVALGIRWSEMRRAFSTPEASDLPPPAKLGAAFAFLLAAVSFWGLHHYLLTPLNQFLGDKQVPQQVRKTADVVRFGERYFRADAVQQLRATRPDLSALRTQAIKTMCNETGRAFESARKGALAYVEHYYTMPAAIMRTGLAFADNPEDQMQREIQSRVFGVDFQKLVTSGAATVKQTQFISEQVDQQWRARVEPLLAQHEVFPSDDVELNVVYEAPNLDSLLDPPGQFMDPRWQGATVAASALLAAGGMEAVAGKTSRAIVKTPAMQGYMARLAKRVPVDGKSKAVLDAVAKGATKLGTGVASSAVGTAAGIVVAWLALEADEVMNREDFEKQIVGEVYRAEAEFLKSARCPA
jgi:hypothetical protein